MTEPTTHSAVKSLAMANGNAPVIRPHQLHTNNAINKKIIRTGSQMFAEYEYIEVMSEPQKRQLFLLMPL